MKKLRIWLMVAGLMVGNGGLGLAAGQNLADFEDVVLSAAGYWAGAPGVSGFTSGRAQFNTPLFDLGGGYTSWAGFACSNRQDAVTPGWSGEFNAIPGGAQAGSNYAIGYTDAFNGVNPTLSLAAPRLVDGLYVTNTNWAYYFITSGDSYFHEAPYGAGDWLRLTITGRDAAGSATGALTIPLADFTNGKSLVLNQWSWVDTSGLGAVKNLEFSVSSNRDFTPYYFAMDTVVPEPASLLLLGLGGIALRRRKF